MFFRYAEQRVMSFLASSDII